MIFFLFKRLMVQVKLMRYGYTLGPWQDLKIISRIYGGLKKCFLKLTPIVIGNN
jgi:hypothetical protein